MYLFALEVCTWEWNIAKWKKNCIKRQAPWKLCVQEIMRKGPHPFAKLWLLCEKLNSTIVMCFHEIDNYLFVHSLLSIPFRRLIRSTENIFCDSPRKAATYCELLLQVLFGDLLHWELDAAVNSIAHFQWSDCFLYHSQRIVSYSLIRSAADAVSLLLLLLLLLFIFIFVCCKCKNPQTPFCVFKTFCSSIKKRLLRLFANCIRYRTYANIYI